MRRKYNRKTKKINKQKVYLMKGCAKNKRGGLGCGPSGCPIPAYSWKQMNANGGKNTMQGGPILGVGSNGGSSFYKPPAPMPGPFIGQSWGAPVDKWPGVDGIGSNHNFPAYNALITDVSRQMKLGGSRKKHTAINKRKKYSKTYKRGGGFSLIPQDLVNLGRGVTFNFKSAYNSLNGYNSPINPLPYKDQLTNSINSNRILV